MRENTLKQQLYAGKAAFGVMCTFPSPPVVEMLGYLGFDWILLDNEHGSITVDSAESCIAAAELSGMAPIVRPVGSKPELITPFLDRGAWGVQVPRVNTAEEACAVVDAAKYGPEGHRGLGSNLPDTSLKFFPSAASRNWSSWKTLGGSHHIADRDYAGVFDDAVHAKVHSTGGGTVTPEETQRVDIALPRVRIKRGNGTARVTSHHVEP